MTRNRISIFLFVFISFAFFGMVCSPSASAENDQLQEADAAAQANNPLANMKAFNLQNYYIGELTESDENAISSGCVTPNPSPLQKPTG